MHNFLLSICSMHWRFFFLWEQPISARMSRLLKTNSNNDHGRSVRCTAHRSTWGRVLLLLFPPTRLSCVKGEAKKAFLSPVRNINAFCLTESSFPDSGLLSSPTLHSSICYQSPKLRSTWEMTGYNWTRVSMCSKYVFVSHLNIGVLCPRSWAVS